jgi:ankyrin repeat protein
MRASKFFCLILAFLLVEAGCRRKPAGTPTTLHQAVRAGNIEQVQSLISGGAEVNGKDEGGWTALDEAFRRGHEDVVELLREKADDRAQK